MRKTQCFLAVLCTEACWNVCGVIWWWGTGLGVVNMDAWELPIELLTPKEQLILLSPAWMWNWLTRLWREFSWMERESGSSLMWSRGMECLMDESSWDKTVFTWQFELLGLWLLVTKTHQQLTDADGNYLGRTETQPFFVYPDDIIIYSPEWEQHFRELQVVFHKLREARLIINMKKCNLF